MVVVARGAGRCPRARGRSAERDPPAEPTPPRTPRAADAPDRARQPEVTGRCRPSCGDRWPPGHRAESRATLPRAAPPRARPSPPPPPPPPPPDPARPPPALVQLRHPLGGIARIESRMGDAVALGRAPRLRHGPPVGD